MGVCYVVYVRTERKREREGEMYACLCMHARMHACDGCYGICRKGTNGVSTNEVTALGMSFDRGTFWVLTLTYLYLPKMTTDKENKLI